MAERVASHAHEGREAATGVLARLKEETLATHRALEDALPLTDPALDRARYVATLAAFLGFHRPAERAVWDEEGHGAALEMLGLRGPERRRAPAAREDLRTLGVPDLEIDRLPEADRLPPLGTLDDALGYLYVMEGATLGARVVARHLERSIGVGESTGGAYFAAHGADTGERWRQLREALERRVREGGDPDGIVRAATLTFGTLHEWLARRGVTRADAG